MNIINNNLQDISILDNKLSMYSKNNMSILDESVILIDPETGEDNYPVKYRKGLIKVNTQDDFDVVSIDMMNQTEMDKIDNDIIENNRKISFKGYNIKLVLDLALTEIPIDLGGVKELADRLVKDKTIDYDVLEYPIFDSDEYEISVDKVVTVLLKRINEQELTIIEYLISIDAIVLDVYDKNGTIYDTHIINELEIYKFIVPNNVE